MARPKTELSPALEKKYNQDLRDTLRRIDLLEAEKKETSKLFKGTIEEEYSRTRVLRDLLDGKISEQTALPGLEGPGERQKGIGSILRGAVMRVEEICDVSVDPRDDADRDAASELTRARRER